MTTTRLKTKDAPDLLKTQLDELLHDKGFEVIRELRFYPERRWRFDIAIPGVMLAVEVEGGVFIGGRHTRGAGYAGDMQKYNTATCNGWALLRFTPSQVLNGMALEVIKEYLNFKKIF